MQDAIILGGGISGLTAAYLAQRKGLDISVIEKNAHAGGPISSLRSEGYLLERGPNSLLLPDPWVEEFIEELGLKSQLQETSALAKKRYIVKGGKPRAVPSNPAQAISSPLLSLRGKLSVFGEPFRPKLSSRFAGAETVASFTRRRLGADFLDYAIDPLVSGIYAGDPNLLILDYAFPTMRGLETEGGSLILGAIKRKRRQRREGKAYKKRSVSFQEGLGTLPKTLAKKLGNRLWLESEVVAVNRIEEHWQVSWKRQGESFEGFARNLLVCLPAYATKRIAWSPAVSERLREAPNLSYPAVHSLALGFKRGQIGHPLDGFGMLMPSKEPGEILGALFSSSLFRGRAPEGHALLTVMCGGTRRPDLSLADKNRLLDSALPDLERLLGIQGEPQFSHSSSWHKSIPQYTREFGPWRATLRGLEEAYGNLFFGGNSIDGVAMGAAILSGRKLARKL